ncbi:MAG: site-specific integrase [Ruminococcaceae bacterium]|nr:site-specific integrase [Oscillospiraceae bacterium]
MNVTASVQTKGNKYYIVLNWKSIDGKRKQKWVGTGLEVKGNNKRKAEQKRIEILQEWKDKITCNENEIMFSDFLILWLEETKYSISETTYYTYLTTVKNSICPFFKNRKIKLCELKPYHIQEFYNQKMEKDKVTANTIYHFHANIHKALDYAVKTERIKTNPSDSVSLPKKEKHIADFYTAEELKLLLDGAKNTKLETIVLLASWFGLRRGEIIGLKWQHIDFDSNTLSIKGTVTDKGKSGSRKKNMKYQEKAKTSSSIRTFPMPEAASAYLKELKAKQEKWQKSPAFNAEFKDFVCIRPNGELIPLDYVTRNFPRLCEKCGLKRLKLHELRHTNISLLVDSGAAMKEVQEWAGHSSYSTTANVYAHVQSKSKIKLAENLANIIG